MLHTLCAICHSVLVLCQCVCVCVCRTLFFVLVYPVHFPVWSTVVPRGGPPDDQWLRVPIPMQTVYKRFSCWGFLFLKVFFLQFSIEAIRDTQTVHRFNTEWCFCKRKDFLLFCFVSSTISARIPFSRIRQIMRKANITRIALFFRLMH